MIDIKIHAPILNAIEYCLKQILEDGKVADKEVNTFLKENKKFGSRDRSIIAECVYDIIRWKLKYIYLLKLSHPQFTYYKHLVLISLLNRNYTIQNINIFDVSEEDIKTLYNNINVPISNPAIAQSYPEDFYALCLAQIGEEWHSIAAALNQRPAVFIRANTLKTTASNLLSLLQKDNIEAEFAPVQELPITLQTKNSIKILSKNNLKNSVLYKQGFFEFQDIGSQTIGTFLINNIDGNNNFETLKILDLCAGAGGKTLHLSALLNNKGKIFATDYSPARLKNLNPRAAYAGCTNIEIIDFNSIKKLNNIDILLMDAPCSGTGTFKRQADLKYKITSSKINEYKTIQAGLLENYAPIVKKSGKIIYATCSILPQENNLQIDAFLQKNPNFKLIDAIQLLPNQYAGDGFYMACLERCY